MKLIIKYTFLLILVLTFVASRKNRTAKGLLTNKEFIDKYLQKEQYIAHKCEDGTAKFVSNNIIKGTKENHPLRFETEEGYIEWYTSKEIFPDGLTPNNNIDCYRKNNKKSSSNYKPQIEKKDSVLSEEYGHSILSSVSSVNDKPDIKFTDSVLYDDNGNQILSSASSINEPEYSESIIYDIPSKSIIKPNSGKSSTKSFAKHSNINQSSVNIDLGDKKSKKLGRKYRRNRK
jgi:hypothetical protein